MIGYYFLNNESSISPKKIKEVLLSIDVSSSGRFQIIYSETPIHGILYETDYSYKKECGRIRFISLCNLEERMKKIIHLSPIEKYSDGKEIIFDLFPSSFDEKNKWDNSKFYPFINLSLSKNKEKLL